MERTFTTKELPPDEMPYEKCIMYGESSLSDAELIAAIIRTGSRGVTSVELARRVLNCRPDRILNLIYMSMDELLEIKGIGKAKAVQLKCIGELAKRIASAERRRTIRLDNPSSIASYYMEQLRHERRELLVLTMYDSSNMLIKDEVLSVGTSNTALISCSDVYRAALKAGAEYIVLLHNHPSGDPDPSGPDIEATRRVKESGKIIGVPLLDHIIIGDNIYFSFREKGMI